MNLDQLFEKFNNNIDIDFFILNLVVATVLALVLAQFYIRFGNAVANRRKFASNFIPLAITTVLIVTIIKSSIALSLGLVGALSIVRFRAAIKDPEELIYLFLVISIGLATGANYPILATIAVSVILILLYINYLLQSKHAHQKDNSMYVNIASAATSVDAFLDIVNKHMQYVELKRLDRSKEGIDVTFICKTESIQALTSMQDALIQLAPESTTVSVVDQPDLIV